MNTLLFKIVWRLVVYPALAFAALSFVFLWIYIHPRRNVGHDKPETFGLKPRPLTLTTADGVKLDAWFVPREGSRKAVVICHGYPMDKSDVLGLTSYLNKDFNLLYIDFRAMGRSGGFFSTGGARETRDVDAAVSWLKDDGMDSVGIYGFSMGAATALLSTNPALKARVADSPFANLREALDGVFSPFGVLRRPLVGAMRLWGLLLTGSDIDEVSPEKSAASITTPVLLIHGDADETVNYSGSLRIKAANPAIELWIIKGAGHGETRYKALSDYEKRVRGFFLKNL
ncbi:MAG: prolyl oligopeptidase family serine peptidase [Elusimicrobia bacterium]|nr:prolyl oligopeptidase family serine peptidase [Elusimicrobiota bacterium]